MSYTEEAEDYFDTHYQLLKSKLKTIYFFHFKTAEQPKFDPEDTEYCDDYGQPYPYTIVYKTISNKISQEGLDNLMYEVASIAELDPKFNQMLFYTEIDNKEDTFWNTMFGKTYQYHELIRVLRYLRSYIENATVFVCANRVDSYVSQYSLTGNDIRVKKSLNIFPGVGSRDAEIIVRDGISYPIKRFFESQGQKLVCNEWFIYFSDTAFGCIKNRLMQLSGTCYLNAILNGIILCPTARNIALQIMRKVDITEYVKPLGLDVCGKKEPTYLFQLLYNTICAKVPLQKTAYKQDIIVEFSKLYSIDPVGGQGGYTMETMNRLLDLIDPHHIVLGFKQQHKPDGTLIRRYSTPTLTPKDHITLRDGPGDFSVITIDFITASKSSSHAVSGIKCDGNYIIFDSNNGILNIDWRGLGGNKDVTDIFKDYMKRTYLPDIATGIFVLPVYIRESTFKKYSKMSSEKLCDDLILN